MSDFDRRKVLQWMSATGAVALAGCTGDGGGDGGDGGGDGGDGGGDGGDGEKFLIGELKPYSGGLGNVGPWSDQVQAVLKKEINDYGGVTEEGLEYDFISGDTETKPSAALSAFETLVAEGVNAISGPTSTTYPNLFQPAKDVGIAVMSPTAGTPQVAPVGGRWIWRSVAGDQLVGAALGQYALNQGYETMVLTFKDDKGSKGFSASIGSYFANNGGEILDKIALDPQAQSYRSELQQALDQDPDVIQQTAGLNVGTLFMKNWNQLGVGDQPILFGNDVINQEFVNKVGPQNMPKNGFGPTPAVAGPSSDKYLELFRDFHDEDPPSPFAAAIYDTSIAFTLAAHNANDASRGAIADNIRDVCGTYKAEDNGKPVFSVKEGMEAIDNGEDINYQGAASNMNFTQNNNVLAPTGINAVREGQWERIDIINAEDYGKLPENY